MRSTKTLSRQAPLPSMLIEIWLAIKTLVKASLVNWLPWSVLKIPGVPCFAKASSNASTQHAGLDERAFQKIVLQRQLSDLGMKHFQIHRRSNARRLGPENSGR